MKQPVKRVRLEGPFAWANGKAARKLVSVLGKENLRFVGGAVRDSLLGRPVQDIDGATPLPPAEVMEKLTSAGIRTLPTGLKHGTVTALFERRKIEITTLRHDVETYGRHAEVAFHADWKQDASRRDFTLNALYLAPGGELYDWFGGAGDLQKGRVRFIGKPEERIREDALRILRFFRFHAWYGKGQLDRGGLAACKSKLHMLDILSAERVRDELMKTLASPDPVPVLEVMEEIGVFRHIFDDGKLSLSKLATLVALETRMKRPSALRRLAAMTPFAEDRLARLGRDLKFSNRQIERLGAMRLGTLALPMAPEKIRKAVYILGHQLFEDRLFLSAGKGEAGALQKALAAGERFKPPKFPVTGKDLQKRGVKPGPEMGDILDVLEKRWVASDFKLSKKELLASLG